MAVYMLLHGIILYKVIKKLWVLQEIFNSTDFIMSEKPDRTSFYTKFIINVMLGIILFSLIC